MNFKYIIAMDFEATQPGRMEVIEFPAVLMDLTTGSILSQFHEFVRPTENLIISPLCSQLTGIYQNTVDRADELSTVLQNFELWLKRVISLYDLLLPNCIFSGSGLINCVFVTWGDYDFKNMLIPECEYKGYEVPSYFRQWADLRKSFNSLYSGGNISFKNALNIANVPLQGRLHSGIDDAKNLANLTRKLYTNGARITSLSKMPCTFMP